MSHVNKNRHMGHTQVTQSAYRPRHTQDFEASRISRKSAHEGGKAFRPTHRPTLSPTRYSWYSFIKARVGLERLSQWNIPATPSGTQPATFRLAAQYLNKLRHRVTSWGRFKYKRMDNANTLMSDVQYQNVKIWECTRHQGWSQWLRGLRHRSAAVRLLRLWARIPLGAWMSFSCECCVLSSRGLCGELITRPEESYRQWCVFECDLEISWMRKTWPTGGCRADKQTNKHQIAVITRQHGQYG
jgi:hypothetical protein